MTSGQRPWDQPDPESGDDDAGASRFPDFTAPWAAPQQPPSAPQSPPQSAPWTPPQQYPPQSPPQPQQSGPWTPPQPANVHGWTPEWNPARTPASRSLSKLAAHPSATSISLIAANVLVWLATSLSGGSDGVLFSRLALSVRGLCSTASGIRGAPNAFTCEAARGTWIPGVADGAWWQLMTSAFVHLSLLHLGVNMAVLWMLGSTLETTLGRPRYLTLFGISALTGSVFVYWLADPLTTTAGASGAVFGLLGALLVLVLRARANPTNLLFWLGINVLLVFVPGSTLSWEAHLGGFLGGMLYTFLATRFTGRRASTAWIAVGIWVTVLVALVAVRTMLL